MERLKKRYEDVWNDKVMLAEQLSVSRVFLSGLMMDAESRYAGSCVDAS